MAKLVFSITHSLLCRGQVWFLSMKTFLSSMLALCLQRMWAEGQGAPLGEGRTAASATTLAPEEITEQ